MHCCKISLCNNYVDWTTRTLICDSDGQYCSRKTFYATQELRRAIVTLNQSAYYHMRFLTESMLFASWGSLRKPSLTIDFGFAGYDLPITDLHLNFFLNNRNASVSCRVFLHAQNVDDCVQEI